MDLWPRNSYLNEGRTAGHADQVLEAALEQAHRAQAAGVPAVLTLNHLAHRVGISCGYLREIVGRRTDPYRTFRIRKRSGGYRQIFVPDIRLLLIQKWIRKYVLSEQATHECSFAYSAGSSSVKCARMHVGCSWLIKVDVQQFFESISEIQIHHVFRSLGYEPLVAFELTRLCTRVAATSKRYLSPAWIVHGNRTHAIRDYQAHKIGHLPQGAPTSPMLSNLAMRGLDVGLADLAKREGLVYTRYSDDISLSTNNAQLSREMARTIIHEVYARLRRHGLRPKVTKTLILPPGAKKIVLGLVLTQDGIALPKSLRRSLECHAYYIRKLGAAAHAQRRGFRSVLAMHRHLFGLVSYAKMVDEEFAATIETTLLNSKWTV